MDNYALITFTPEQIRELSRIATEFNSNVVVQETSVSGVLKFTYRLSTVSQSAVLVGRAGETLPV